MPSYPLNFTSPLPQDAPSLSIRQANPARGCNTTVPTTKVSPQLEDYVQCVDGSGRKSLGSFGNTNASNSRVEITSKDNFPGTIITVKSNDTENGKKPAPLNNETNHNVPVSSSFPSSARRGVSTSSPSSSLHTFDQLAHHRQHYHQRGASKATTSFVGSPQQVTDDDATTTPKINTKQFLFSLPEFPETDGVGNRAYMNAPFSLGPSPDDPKRTRGSHKNTMMCTTHHYTTMNNSNKCYHHHTTKNAHATTYSNANSFSNHNYDHTCTSTSSISATTSSNTCNEKRVMVEVENETKGSMRGRDQSSLLISLASVPLREKCAEVAHQQEEKLEGSVRTTNTPHSKALHTIDGNLKTKQKGEDELTYALPAWELPMPTAAVRSSAAKATPKTRVARAQREWKVGGNKYLCRDREVEVGIGSGEMDRSDNGKGGQIGPNPSPFSVPIKSNDHAQQLSSLLLFQQQEEVQKNKPHGLGLGSRDNGTDAYRVGDTYEWFGCGKGKSVADRKHNDDSGPTLSSTTTVALPQQRGISLPFDLSACERFEQALAEDLGSDWVYAGLFGGITASEMDTQRNDKQHEEMKKIRMLPMVLPPPSHDSFSLKFFLPPADDVMSTEDEDEERGESDLIESIHRLYDDEAAELSGKKQSEHNKAEAEPTTENPRYLRSASSGTESSQGFFIHKPLRFRFAESVACLGVGEDNGAQRTTRTKHHVDPNINIHVATSKPGQNAKTRNSSLIEEANKVGLSPAAMCFTQSSGGTAHTKSRLPSRSTLKDRDESTSYMGKTSTATCATNPILALNSTPTAKNCVVVPLEGAVGKKVIENSNEDTAKQATDPLSAFAIANAHYQPVIARASEVSAISFEKKGQQLAGMTNGGEGGERPATGHGSHPSRLLLAVPSFTADSTFFEEIPNFKLASPVDDVSANPTDSSRTKGDAETQQVVQKRAPHDDDEEEEASFRIDKPPKFLRGAGLGFGGVLYPSHSSSRSDPPHHTARGWPPQLRRVGDGLKSDNGNTNSMGDLTQVSRRPIALDGNVVVTSVSHRTSLKSDQRDHRLLLPFSHEEHRNADNMINLTSLSSFPPPRLGLSNALPPISAAASISASSPTAAASLTRPPHTFAASHAHFMRLRDPNSQARDYLNDLPMTNTVRSNGKNSNDLDEEVSASYSSPFTCVGAREGGCLSERLSGSINWLFHPLQTPRGAEEESLRSHQALQPLLRRSPAFTLTATEGTTGLLTAAISLSDGDVRSEGSFPLSPQCTKTPCTVLPPKATEPESNVFHPLFLSRKLGELTNTRKFEGVDGSKNSSSNNKINFQDDDCIHHHFDHTNKHHTSSPRRHPTHPNPINSDRRLGLSHEHNKHNMVRDHRNAMEAATSTTLSTMKPSLNVNSGTSAVAVAAKGVGVGIGIGGMIHPFFYTSTGSSQVLSSESSSLYYPSTRARRHNFCSGASGGEDEGSPPLVSQHGNNLMGDRHTYMGGYASDGPTDDNAQNEHSIHESYHREGGSSGAVGASNDGTINGGSNNMKLFEAAADSGASHTGKDRLPHTGTSLEVKTCCGELSSDHMHLNNINSTSRSGEEVMKGERDVPPSLSSSSSSSSSPASSRNDASTCITTLTESPPTTGGTLCAATMHESVSISTDTHPHQNTAANNNHDRMATNNGHDDIRKDDCSRPTLFPSSNNFSSHAPTSQLGESSSPSTLRKDCQKEDQKTYKDRTCDEEAMMISTSSPEDHCTTITAVTTKGATKIDINGEVSYSSSSLSSSDPLAGPSSTTDEGGEMGGTGESALPSSDTTAANDTDAPCLSTPPNTRTQQGIIGDGEEVKEGEDEKDTYQNHESAMVTSIATNIVATSTVTASVDTCEARRNIFHDQNANGIHRITDEIEPHCTCTCTSLSLGELVERLITTTTGRWTKQSFEQSFEQSFDPPSARPLSSQKREAESMATQTNSNDDETLKSSTKATPQQTERKTMPDEQDRSDNRENQDENQQTRGNAIDSSSRHQQPVCVVPAEVEEGPLASLLPLFSLSPPSAGGAVGYSSPCPNTLPLMEPPFYNTGKRLNEARESPPSIPLVRGSPKGKGGGAYGTVDQFAHTLPSSAPPSPASPYPPPFNTFDVSTASEAAGSTSHPCAFTFGLLSGSSNGSASASASAAAVVLPCGECVAGGQEHSIVTTTGFLDRSIIRANTKDNSKPQNLACEDMVSIPAFQPPSLLPRRAETAVDCELSTAAQKEQLPVFPLRALERYPFNDYLDCGYPLQQRFFTTPRNYEAIKKHFPSAFSLSNLPRHPLVQHMDHRSSEDNCGSDGVGDVEEIIKSNIGRELPFFKKPHSSADGELNDPYHQWMDVCRNPHPFLLFGVKEMNADKILRVVPPTLRALYSSEPPFIPLRDYVNEVIIGRIFGIHYRSGAASNTDEDDACTTTKRSQNHHQRQTLHFPNEGTGVPHSDDVLPVLIVALCLLRRASALVSRTTFPPSEASAAKHRTPKKTANVAAATPASGQKSGDLHLAGDGESPDGSDDAHASTYTIYDDPQWGFFRMIVEPKSGKAHVHMPQHLQGDGDGGATNARNPLVLLGEEEGRLVLTNRSLHRAMLAAVLIAVKTTLDGVFSLFPSSFAARTAALLPPALTSLQLFATAGGAHPREIALMETAFLRSVGYRTFVGPDEFNAMAKLLKAARSGSYCGEESCKNSQ